MDEAQIEHIHLFDDFNHFFTRKLKQQARQICVHADHILSPVDGQISQLGKIRNTCIIQAKHQDYTLQQLLAGDSQLSAQFADGQFMTIYLSPRDYHRIHMPVTGRLIQMLHVPGRLFSVNPASVHTIPCLFARNERVISVFSTGMGKMALIQVGAIFVSSIETTWHGVVTPPRQRRIRRWHYSDNAPVLQQGMEMGRFNMGSTVILLFEKNRINWLESLVQGHPLQLGQLLGKRQ